MRSKPPPLQSRTMTLEELQQRTLDVLAKVRKQFFRNPYEEGLSDWEFLDEVVSPLEIEIRQDQMMQKILRGEEHGSSDGTTSTR